MKKIILTALVVLLYACSSVVNAEIHYKVLDKVNEPKDIKEMNIKQLTGLAKDIRAGILNKTNLVGGHVGSDLGIVEVTIAMHYVFDSPTDKFVFDTSHQTYPHKMLTGRKEAFTNPLDNKNITGFSNFNESPHDFFIMGHTSTSISLAEGMAKARDLKGDKYNVIALIGDGSLGGGEALEGLNNASELNSNFIIIVNDNEMCIAENHGGLYKNLKLLRESSGTAENNMFKAWGYDYYYVSDGHDIQGLINMFKKVKDTNKPTVVHIHTTKGKGYLPAMQDKEKYHWILPGYMDKKGDESAEEQQTYNKITTDYIISCAETDKSVFAISPATPGACGFYPEQRELLGAQYIDVGIAEQHATGLSAGAAKNGGKPILMVCSSFIQRAYDQLSQDIAINNSPAVVLIYSYGISSGDVTHNGVFDIPLISNIPNIVFMSPANKEEYLAVLNWAIKQDKYPVVIRVPQGEVLSTGKKDLTDYSILNRYKVINDGNDIAIVAEGSFLQLGKQLRDEIKAKLNIDATLINPVYLSGLDYELLDSLKTNHTLVITLENGVVDGGFGEKISRYYADSEMKVLNYGAQKEFTDRVPLDELLAKYHLTKELIVQDIINLREPDGSDGAGVNMEEIPAVNEEPAPDVNKTGKETKKEAVQGAKKEDKPDVKVVDKEVKKDSANNKTVKKQSKKSK